MKLYDAITDVVFEFGKDTLANSKVLNMLVDYNAFEESRALKLVLKMMITEGYVNQLLTLKDWSNTGRIVQQIVAATSFNDVNVRYIIECLGYGLGITTQQPQYGDSTPANPKPTPAPSTPAPTKKQPSPSSHKSIKLDKTSSQFYNMDEDDQYNYIEAAQDYLESIIEYKGDIENGLGVKISASVEYDGSNIEPKFELTGKPKARKDDSIVLNILLYGENNKVMTKEEVYLDTSASFQVVEVYILSNQYRRVGNIKRIVVYWQKM